MSGIDFCKCSRGITRDIIKQLKAGIDCRSCSKRFNPDLSAPCYFQPEEENQANRMDSAEQDDTAVPNPVANNSSDSEESETDDPRFRREETHPAIQEECWVTTDPGPTSKGKTTERADLNVQT